MMRVIEVAKNGCRKHCAQVLCAFDVDIDGSDKAIPLDGSVLLQKANPTGPLPQKVSIINMPKFLGITLDRQPDFEWRPA